MKKMIQFLFSFLFISFFLVACTGCGNNNTGTTSTDSSTTTTNTTDSAGSMGKMGNSGSMKMMTDSNKNDTGGRNTQDIPPPKPKK